jgi:hypothetical protein
MIRPTIVQLSFEMPRLTQAESMRENYLKVKSLLAWCGEIKVTLDNTTITGETEKEWDAEHITDWLNHFGDRTLLGFRRATQEYPVYIGMATNRPTFIGPFASTAKARAYTITWSFSNNGEEVFVPTLGGIRATGIYGGDRIFSDSRILDPYWSLDDIRSAME